MFFKKETIVVICQLIFIVILSLIFSTTSLSPINNGVEGFYSSSLEYTDVSAPTIPKDDLYSLNSTTNNTSECKKVDGFPGHGVFCTPSSKPDNIDIYSQAKGDLACESLGYYNSRGQLCLDDNMKRMLYTRGANATGGNGQIGSS
jgi:hypothetical protein